MIFRNRLASSPGSAGFSMIDVLVAIIVLAVSLLALGALQGTLTRNTADARARSQIAAFAEGLIEQARSASYDCVGSAKTACATPTTTGTVTITPSSTGSAAAKNAYAAQTTAGVSNLSVSEKVTTYYGAAGSFSTTKPSPFDSTTPNYKQLAVTTTWTDASGAARTLELDSIVSPLQNSVDNTLSNSLPPVSSSSSSPIVRETNPGAATGVIPIAVSGTSNSAASNPKPQIVALNGKSSKVVGTSYSVLTYQNPDTDGSAVIQKRVETQVVGCTCKYGAGSTATTGTSADVFAQAFRPTYWDGSQYVRPKGLTTGTPPVPTYNTNHPGPDPSVVQSDYCTECCRDHHDQATDTVKFNPFNTDPTSQYKTYDYTGSPPTLTEAMGGTDQFVAACRLIRVDGQYRTATDLNSEHFGLLATQVYPNATTPIPDQTTYQPKYIGFVQGYLTAKYVNSGNPDANALYAADGLNDPSTINLSDTLYHYLDARGLYVDHLEAEAVQAISDANGNCTDTNKANCILPLLPFTAINTTELATWTSCTAVPTTAAPCIDGSGTLQVFNGAKNTYDGAGNFIVSGYVAKASNPVAPWAYAVATMTNSNAGVAIAQPVDPNDQATKSDAQQFKIANTGTGSTFSVTLGSSSANAYDNPINSFTVSFPTVTWEDAATSQSQLCGNSTGKTAGNPNPYSCQPDVLASTGTALGIVVAGYNPTVSSNTNYTPTCAGTASKMSTTQYCPNYAVTGVTQNGTALTGPFAATSDGTVSESTQVAFPSLLPSDKIVVNFTRTTNNLATYTCSAAAGNGGKYTATWNACP